jgi:hypothetical protein
MDTKQSQQQFNLSASKEIVIAKYSGRAPVNSTCKKKKNSTSFDIVERLVSIKGRDSVTARDGYYGRTSLHCALEYKSPLETVEILIEFGGSELVMSRGYRGRTTLHCAFEYSARVEIVERFIDVGGIELITARDNDGRTPLHDACRYNAPAKMVEKLINLGGKKLVTARDDDGRTSLHYACENDNSLEVVKLLIQIGKGELVATRDNDKCTPLHDACTYKAPFEIIELLVKTTGGCLDWKHVTRKMKAKVMRGKPILQLAIATKAPPKVLRYMIDHFDCINVKDSKGRYPLQVAIEEGLWWEDGMQVLVGVSDEGVIGYEDPVTGLFPFMLAAIGDNCELVSVYELLRVDPDRSIVRSNLKSK